MGLPALRLPTPGGDRGVWSGGFLNPWLLADHNADGTHMGVWNVKSYYYGAKGDGVTNDSTAIAAAIADCAAAGGGVVYFPPGTYVNTAVLNVTTTTVNLVGSGSANTTILHNGTGDCFKVLLGTFTVQQAGRIAGMTITGTSSANGAGVHIQDTVGFALEDVVIQTFTHASGAGLWLDNVVQFVERTTCFRLHLNGNTKGLRFTVNGGGNSFGYGKWFDLKMNVNSGQTGISVENNSFVYSNFWNVNCNVAGGAANTAAVVRLAGTAQIANGFGSFFCEQTTGTGAHFLVCPASTLWGGEFSVSRDTLDYSVGGSLFKGPVSQQTLSSPGAVVIDAGLFAITPGIAQVTLQANATSSSIINGSWGQTLTIVWSQDATGSRTVSWPSGVVPAGGAFPAQASPSKRTSFTCYYDGATWWETGRAVNVG